MSKQITVLKAPNTITITITNPSKYYSCLNVLVLDIEPLLSFTYAENWTLCKGKFALPRGEVGQ